MEISAHFAHRQAVAHPVVLTVLLVVDLQRTGSSEFVCLPVVWTVKKFVWQWSFCRRPPPSSSSSLLAAHTGVLTSGLTSVSYLLASVSSSMFVSSCSSAAQAVPSVSKLTTVFYILQQVAQLGSLAFKCISMVASTNLAAPDRVPFQSPKKKCMRVLFIDRQWLLLKEKEKRIFWRWVCPCVYLFFSFSPCRVIRQ